jgi:hypothetical protein
MAQRVSQIGRVSVVEPNPVLRVSQTTRQATVNPNNTLRVSQICRQAIISLPVPTTLFCWARQVNFPAVTAVTPVLISPPA